MRRLIPMGCALALALALLPATASAATPGVNVSRVNDYGDPYVRSASSASDTATAWSDLVASGAKTVRAFVPWHIDSLQLRKYDAFASKARAHGLAVDLVVTGTAGSMATPSAYADNVGKLAAHLRGKVAGYEVWNEPDDSIFWKDGPQPGDYTALLKDAYKAIKAADPGAKVLVGGLVGNDYDFLERLYANGAKGHFDAVGVHTDTACNTTDPREYGRDPNGRISRWSFTGYREVRATMLAHGDDKPVWMTELGWSTTTAVCNTGARAGTKPGGVSQSQQATFLTRAYQCLAGDAYVQQGIWFNLFDFNSSAPGYDQQLGLVTDSFVRKPSFTAFTRAGSLGAIPCGGVIDSAAPQVQLLSPRDQMIYYTGPIPVKIVAHDGDRVQDINLVVDGHNVGVQTIKQGTTATASLLWWGAGKLAFGPHTVEARARDDSRNVGVARITIVRVGGGGYTQRIGSRLRVHYSKKIRHRKLRIKGSMRFDDGVRGAGKVEFRFFRRKHGHWKRRSTRHKSAFRPFRFTYRFPDRGRWRVKARFRPDGPFEPAKVKTRTFKVR